ncbi:hypothetical protein ACFFX0_20850 [Citricoccus parietis]|uniref:Uncharacterized protein n=1 Tax=Citricoccus parietis TaxID=592307 RepID=A0ABV5G3K3_9MICC
MPRSPARSWASRTSAARARFRPAARSAAKPEGGTGGPVPPSGFEHGVGVDVSLRRREPIGRR